MNMVKCWTNVSYGRGLLLKILRACMAILLSLVLAGCAVEGSNPQNNDSNKTFEGIKVEGNILSNAQGIDEAIIEVTISNETDEAFRGSVTVLHGFNSWDIDVDMIAPNSSISKQTKTGYIDDNKRSFSYRVEGEFVEVHESKLNYEILYRPEGTYAFYVQVDEVSEEAAVSVVKDLYTKYGQNLAHISIYDSNLDEEINEENRPFPKAEFFNNALGRGLTIYKEDGSSEDIEFELP